MDICITYCSWQKDDRLENTGEMVTPDKLYLSKRIQNFIATCREKGFRWGIFSDYCGILFENDKQHWYDYHPDSVPETAVPILAKAFVEKLERFDRIWYFYDPATLHPLYQRIVEVSGLGDKVVWVKELDRIGVG